MNGYRSLCLLLACLAWLSLEGCAAFRGGETKPPSSWPLSSGPGKQSISLIVTGEGMVNGRKVDTHPAALKAWQAAAERAYKDSGLFSDVQGSAADTDLRAEIHVIDRGNANQGLAFLSGFTMTLVPAYAKGEYRIKTTLKDKEGKEVGSFETKESFSFWIEFFLVFVMPFNWPNTVASELLYDLNRSAIDQALAAGALQAMHQGEPRQWAFVP